jgi:hypothetical protein
MRFPARAAIAPVLALAAATAAAGCGAGVNATTQKFYAPADGVSRVQGDIRVLNALVVAPAEEGGEGGAATIAMVIANDGTRPDRLISVDAGDAGEVVLSGPREIPAKGVLTFAGPTAEATAVIPEFRGHPGEIVSLSFTFERTGVVEGLRTIAVAADGYYEGFAVRPTATSLPTPAGSPVQTPSPTAGLGGGTPVVPKPTPTSS